MPSGCRGTAVARRRSARCPSPPRSARRGVHAIARVATGGPQGRAVLSRRRASPGLRGSTARGRCRPRRHGPPRCGAAGAGLPPLPFGAALHLGEILWGHIGAADRLDFTSIGPAVNLFSRVEGLCRPLGRSVLISVSVAAETTAPPVPLGEHPLRGIAAPRAVFTLPDG